MESSTSKFSARFVLSFSGFVRIGGITALEFKYMRAVPDTTLNNPNTTCGYPRQDAWHIFRHISKSDYPWLGTILRTTFGSLWYWCANQVPKISSKTLSTTTIIIIVISIISNNSISTTIIRHTIITGVIIIISFIWVLRRCRRNKSIVYIYFYSGTCTKGPCSQKHYSC